MNIENKNENDYELVMPIQYVSKEELKKKYPDAPDSEKDIRLTVIPKGTEVDGPNVWKGFKFPMGGFMVWSKDGRMATGKCDPITHEILEWNEYEVKKNGREVD